MWILLVIAISKNGEFIYMEKQRNITQESCIEAQNHLKHFDIQSVCVESKGGSYENSYEIRRIGY